jgi:hypothetical protein
VDSEASAQVRFACNKVSPEVSYDPSPLLSGDTGHHGELGAPALLGRYGREARSKGLQRPLGAGLWRTIDCHSNFPPAPKTSAPSDVIASATPFPSAVTLLRPAASGGFQRRLTSVRVICQPSPSRTSVAAVPGESAEGRRKLAHVVITHPDRVLCGLGWSRRPQLVHAGLNGARGFSERVSKYLGKKYGCSPKAGAGADVRVAQLLRMLADRLKAQHPGRDMDYPYECSIIISYHYRNLIRTRCIKTQGSHR